MVTRDTVVLAPAGYLLDPEIGSDYERPWRLAEGLARRGLRVVVVAREVTRIDALGPSVELASPPGHPPTGPVGKVIDRVNLYVHARRIAHREVALGRALVVHHVGPCGESSPSLITKLPVPFIYGPLPGARPSNRADDEWLIWLRTPNATSSQTRLSAIAAGMARPAAHFLWRKTVRRATVVTVEAQANAPKGVPNIVVIPPGVDVVRFSPRERDEPVVGRVIAVGNLLARKSYDVLIRAIGRVVRQYRPAHLMLVGSGPEEQYLRSLVNELGIESSVAFIGSIPRAALPRLLQSAEVFCHPATWDTFPLAPLEAMASGLPTMVSSAGALPEIIGDAGVVHAVGDERQLAQQLLELLSSHRLRKVLGIAARSRVLERFTWQAMADAYIDLYARLAKSGVG